MAEAFEGGRTASTDPGTGWVAVLAGAAVGADVSEVLAFAASTTS